MTLIRPDDIVESVRAALQYISIYHAPDYLERLVEAWHAEESAPARNAIGRILESARLAALGRRPICQDTGMVTVFAKLGQGARIGGDRPLDQLINEYHWGAIYTRPQLDDKARAICALSSMTVLGRYDRQIRRRISGALRIGMSSTEIMEVFIQLTLYGGYFTTRTAMQIARSVFTEQGIEA